MGRLSSPYRLYTDIDAVLSIDPHKVEHPNPPDTYCGPASRKGPRPLESDFDEADFVDEFEGPELQYQNIEVGDSMRITETYLEVLEAVQQRSLAKIENIWIETIEPMKQSKFPYNGRKRRKAAVEKHEANRDGESTKPGWWPEGVIHREPDHIGKPGQLNRTCREPLLTRQQTE